MNFSRRFPAAVLCSVILGFGSCDRTEKPATPDPGPEPEKDCYALDLASVDWTSSLLLEVRDKGGHTIALATKEYLGPALDRQAVLVYPVRNDGHFNTDSIFVSRVTLAASGASYNAPVESIHGGTLRYFSEENSFYYNDVREINEFPRDVVYVKVRADGSSEVQERAFTKSNAMISPLILDYQSYKYPLVKTGGQVWTRENLRCTSYSDGSTVRNSGAWNATSPNYGESHNKAAGILYNAYVLDKGNIAPQGWKVPAALAGGEWASLAAFAGSASALKTTGNDISGFSALPSGRITSSGGYYEPDEDDILFWTSTEYASDKSYFAKIFHKTAGETIQYSSKTDKRTGFAVRLVREFDKL